MKLPFYFPLLFVSTLALAANHHIPANRDDQGPNLPEVGASLFDKIFSSVGVDGKATHDVPFPLGKLLDRVGEAHGDFVHTMMPFSRSLQRPVDLSYDPLLNPRIVLSPARDPLSQAKNKLFLGYVKARDQLEVISYNDEAGRFEFQIVRDYSTNPRVLYVNRGKCLSCHQGQAPIFSPPAWEDSSFGIMGELLVTKLGLGANNSANRDVATKQLFGPVRSRDNVAMFDLLVRNANQIALDERVWLHGCGADDECRLGLLLQTLAPYSGEASAYIRHTRGVIEASSFPAQGFYSSFLRSTPLNVPRLMDRFGSAESIVRSPEALGSIIGSIYNLGPAENPATPRPIPINSVDFSAPLASFPSEDLDLLRKETGGQDQIAASLIRQFASGDRALFAGAINKNAVMRAVLMDAGSPAAKRYDAWLTKATPAKELFHGELPPVFQRQELNLFSRHCAACHAAGLPFPPQFLLGTEAEVAEKIRALKERMLFKLEAGLMPPNKADREALRASGDYERLVRYLTADGAPHLELGLVPSPQRALTSFESQSAVLPIAPPRK